MRFFGLNKAAEETSSGVAIGATFTMTTSVGLASTGVGSTAVTVTLDEAPESVVT